LSAAGGCTPRSPHLRSTTSGNLLEFLELPLLTGISNQTLVAEIDKIEEQQKQIPYNGTSVTLPIPMPVFSPVLNCNSSGTVNFIVNMCPSET